jgi:nucleotide-binding universal stress UspA family protein
MTTVMVPVDGSVPSEAALAHGLGLAARYQARLLFLGVEEPDQPSLSPFLETVGRLPGVEVLKTTGDPADEILRHASSESADMLVLNSQGQGRLADWVLGSVTERVMHRAPCPVLIVPAGPEEPGLAAAQAGKWPRYSRILLPVDGGEVAERALTPAAFLAARDRAELCLLQIVDPDEIWGPDGPEIYLQNLTRQLEQSGVRAFPVARRASAAAATILEYARRGIDLIVMATHARTGLSRILLGSVADTVARQAPCPVLLVRGDSALTR